MSLRGFVLFLSLGLSVTLTCRAQSNEGMASTGSTEASQPQKLSLEVSKDDLKNLTTAKESKSEDNMLNAVSRILAKDPQNLLALNALAVFYFENGKPGLSKIIINRALTTHSGVPGLHNNLGVIYLAENDPRSALASFRKSLELRSNYPTGAANLASIYLEHKDFQRALSPLRDAYKETKSSLDKGEAYAVEFANNYAVALTGLGDLKAAEDVYENITEKNSKNTTVLLNYAILLVERLNKSKEALSVLNKIKFIADDRQVLARVEELEKKATSKE